MEAPKTGECNQLPNHTPIVASTVEEYQRKEHEHVARLSKEFEKELESLLNAKCQENASDTPDFMLAEYLVGCLKLWNETTTKREIWYGRKK